LGPLDFLNHLLGFAAPAFAVAVLVTLAARLVLPRGGAPRNWWAALGINFLAGLLVLGAGLWFFGRDGKMATYAAMVVGVATCQWLIGRAWRA
jgi:hypothetical protein